MSPRKPQVGVLAAGMCVCDSWPDRGGVVCMDNDLSEALFVKGSSLGRGGVVNPAL